MLSSDNHHHHQHHQHPNTETQNPLTSQPLEDLQEKGNAAMDFVQDENAELAGAAYRLQTIVLSNGTVPDKISTLANSTRSAFDAALNRLRSLKLRPEQTAVIYRDLLAQYKCVTTPAEWVAAFKANALVCASDDLVLRLQPASSASEALKGLFARTSSRAATFWYAFLFFFSPEKDEVKKKTHLPVAKPRAPEVEWYQSPNSTINSFSMSPNTFSTAAAWPSVAVLGGRMIRGPKTPSTAERPVCEWYQKSPGPSTTRNLISCLLLSFALFCRGHWWTKATPSYCFFFFFFGDGGKENGRDFEKSRGRG